jgi:PAS domain S-box-containing protein
MPETPPNGFAAEPALLGSLHLAAIIESSDDAIIGKDLRGIIQSWNRGAERMFGYTVAEAVGKSVSILAVPGRLDEIPDILQRIARGERIDHYQTQRQTKDGRVLVISLTVSPIHDATGKVIGASKIARDVTELVDYQNALRQSESSFRQLADSMPHMVWTATPDGNVDYYNRHWHDYTGMSLDQSRNWGWQPVLHPSHLQSTIDLWTHSFTSGEPFKVECLLKRASDGAYRWHLSQAQPVRDTQGKIVRWFGACSDVHDYKQAASENQTLNEHLETRVRERTAELDLANQQLSHANAELHVSALRLEQTNRELQDFASVTSHDLQEPLRKVQAFGDRLNIECRRQSTSAAAAIWIACSTPPSACNRSLKISCASPMSPARHARFFRWIWPKSPAKSSPTSKFAFLKPKRWYNWVRCPPLMPTPSRCASFCRISSAML